jgi:hypothetical protein
MGAPASKVEIAGGVFGDGAVANEETGGRRSAGHVLGGGCELVMLCDMTIAADNATFGEPEVRFSAVGPAIVMPMIIGYKKARE